MNLDSVINALRDASGVLGRGAEYGARNIKTALPEALRNYVGNAEWQEKKQAQDLYGGDFEAQERADKMMGFGTDVGGLVGAIKGSRITPRLTPYQEAHALAQKRAALPVEEGGLGLPPDNTAMDRMEAMRDLDIPDLYHGGAEEIANIDKSKYGSSTGAKSAKQAFWAVDEPSTAVGYSHYAATHAPVKKLMQEAEKYEKIGDWDTYDDILAKAEELEKQFQESNLAGQNVTPLVALKGKNEAIDLGGQHFIDEEQKINRHLLQSKAKGADFATFKNLSDDPFFDSRPATHVAVLNPSKIRSRFAAFDPFRRNEADLLAGGSAVPIATLSDDEDRKKLADLLRAK
jgi:hypothetical protein